MWHSYKVLRSFDFEKWCIASPLALDSGSITGRACEDTSMHDGYDVAWAVAMITAVKATYNITLIFKKPTFTQRRLQETHDHSL